MQKDRPSYAYGEKLMKQMGWREGKGLGRNEDGNADFIKVKKKLNTKGIGFNGIDDRWVEHQEAFDSLLSQLNDGDAVAIEKKLIGVEARAFKLGGRVHYSKFLRGKDLSQKKQEELNAIVVKRKKKNDEASVPEVETKEEETMCGVKTHTSSLSYQEYFTQRMEALRRRKGSMKNKDWEPSRHTESNVHISEKEGTEAASQEVVPLDACTGISCLNDQECSKPGRKKTRQKSIQSAFEESTQGGTMVTNGHADEATVLATEELDSAPRKPKKSKWKSPDIFTRTDRETEQFEETSAKKKQKVSRRDPVNCIRFAESATVTNKQLGDACARVSCVDDQECSKRGRKKMRQKSIQSAFEESTPGGAMAANEHADQATVLATEELGIALRKPKKSKCKSPDNLNFYECAEAASQKLVQLVPLDACTNFSRLDDQECSRQGRKKTRQRSVQSALEESTPKGAVAANECVGEATTLRKPKNKNSKRKSPDSLTRTDGETEQFEETNIKKKRKVSRGNPVNGIKFVESAVVMNEQSSKAFASVSAQLECTTQQLSKEKAKKTPCDDLAETDSLQDGAVEKKVKKKRRTPEDTKETSIEVTKDTRGTSQHLGKSAAFKELESAVRQPKESRESEDDQAEKDRLEEKADKIKLNRRNMEKVDVMASETRSEHYAPEKSTHKKKKGKERTERTTREDQQEEAESEVRAKAEPKQKRKRAVASVSDEQPIKQDENKLKLKKEERTETEESRQEGQPAECAPEATQPEALPGNCTSTTKQLGSAGSQEVVPSTEPPRRKAERGTRKRTSATDMASKYCEEEEFGLQRWQVGHNFRYPYKLPPVSYETAAAMACWLVNTVEKTATKITPNKVCHLSKDEYAELLGNHIYNRHRTSNWMQIPGYASKLWLAKCVPQLVSSLRKKAQLEQDGVSA